MCVLLPIILVTYYYHYRLIKIECSKLQPSIREQIESTNTWNGAIQMVHKKINRGKHEVEAVSFCIRLLQELVKMAEERCPAMYSMSHEIKVNVQIK